MLGVVMHLRDVESQDGEGRRRRFQRLRSDPEVFALVQLVADERGVTLTALMRRSRGHGKAAAARELAVYLAHVMLERPQDVVAELFARDRTTIAHACHLSRTSGPGRDRCGDRADRIAVVRGRQLRAGVQICGLKRHFCASCAVCSAAPPPIATAAFVLADGRRGKATEVVSLVRAGALSGDETACRANDETPRWLKRARLDHDAFQTQHRVTVPGPDGAEINLAESPLARLAAGDAHFSSVTMSRRASGCGGWWSGRNCSRG